MKAPDGEPQEQPSPDGTHTHAGLPVQLQTPASHSALASLKHLDRAPPLRPAPDTSSSQAEWPHVGGAARTCDNMRPPPRASAANVVRMPLRVITPFPPWLLFSPRRVDAASRKAMVDPGARQSRRSVKLRTARGEDQPRKAGSRRTRDHVGLWRRASEAPAGGGGPPGVLTGGA